MNISRLDIAYRRLLLTKYFTKGWGEPKNLISIMEFRKIMSNRDTCYRLVDKNHQISIQKKKMSKDCNIYDGSFTCPLVQYFPELIPQKVRTCYFQLIVPKNWNDDFHPVVMHFAGTGDHYFWKRRNLMAKHLLKRGIASIIIENPFYGLRKPESQVRSCLHYVSDIFVMGGCLILESIALNHWLENNGFGPLGLTGISMGGHMASLAATNWPKPIVLVPCLSWSTASNVFTEGVMMESINWGMLQKQYTSNNLFYDSLSKMCNIVDQPFCNRMLRDFQVEIMGETNRDHLTPFELLNLINSNCATPELEAQSLDDFVSKVRICKRSKPKKEAIVFMRSIMDECTHLKNFSTPVDTTLVTAVCADTDGYVPRCGVVDLKKLWPGITVRYIKGGHVGACIWHRNMFVKCIDEAFERAKVKLAPPEKKMTQTV